MSGLLYLLAAIAAAILVIATARLADSRAWRRSLLTYELQLPADLELPTVVDWLSAVAALTHAPRGALLPQPPLVVESVGDHAGVRYLLRVPRRMEGAVLASLRAALPGVRLAQSDESPRTPRRHVSAAEVRLSGRLRQLSLDRSELTSRAVLAALQPVDQGVEIRWQWIITGAGTPPPLPSPDGHRSLPWWLEEVAPADADELRSARLKQRMPLFHATGRLVVTATSRRYAEALFGRSWGAIRLLNAPGARLVHRLLPVVLVVHHFRSVWLPLGRWPVRVNSAELAGLLGFPTGSSPLPGVPLGVTRQVAPPREIPSAGTVVADATYPGLDRPLAIATADRLMHMSLLGPTGTGKSTLMINMALQDITRGDGLALLDPKADMASDLLLRIDERRWNDVVLIDPSDTETPVGFNVLANDGTEASRELAVDHVLHVFHEQWKDFWGPRTDAILRAALLTLTATEAADGSAFTVCELPALLTQPSFRQWVTSRPSIPHAVHEFWDWFESLSNGERTQVVGPVLNKLTALTQRTPLRLMLGQSTGIDLPAALRERKLLIMPLARGLIGSETAALLSSLMLASLWQATLGRARLSHSDRLPFWLYVDEAAEVVRLPLDLSDVMAEARGYGLGLTMAMQHLSQLPTAVKNTMLATVRSQVVFQVEPADARVLAAAFEPTLSEADLRTLPAHEVAIRLAAGGKTSRPTTGVTRPLPDPVSDGLAIRALSRQQYGTARRDVEQGLLDRLTVKSSVPQDFGQRPRRNGGRA